MTHQLDAASNHPHPALLSGRLGAPKFLINCIEVRTVPSVARNLEVHYCTFGLGTVNDAQTVRIDTARGKDNDQQNLSIMIM